MSKKNKEQYFETGERMKKMKRKRVGKSEKTWSVMFRQ